MAEAVTTGLRTCRPGIPWRDGEQAQLAAPLALGLEILGLPQALDLIERVPVGAGGAA